MDYNALAMLPREKQNRVLKAIAFTRSQKRNRIKNQTRFARILIYLRNSVRI
jgi:hypothetical protein